MRQPEDRSTALVIRLWHEAGTPPDEVRARLMASGDGEAQRWTETVAAGEDEIVAAVRRFLHAFTER
jgi:hypothetical protein